MCRVIAIRPVEECLDGTTIKEFELASPMTEAVMRRIAEDGKLKYFPHFPRPYFRIDRRDAYIIQGVIGMCTFRVVFARSATTDSLEELLQCHIEKGESCGC
jgi:hypothetical protein